MTAFARGSLWLALCSLAVVSGTLVAMAQAPKTGAAADKKAAATKAKKVDSTPAAATPAAVNSDGQDYEGPTLPKDFVPPRPIPEIMTLEKPLIPAADYKKLLRDLPQGKHAQSLRLGDKSDEKMLKEGARVTVLALSIEPNDELAARRAEIQKKIDDLKKRNKDTTDLEAELEKELAKPTLRSQIAEYRDKLIREINSAANLPTIKQEEARKFREFYMQEVVKRATELLDGNFSVRLNAVILLGELTIAEAAQKGNPDEPFSPAVVPLLEVISDKKQPDSIKILAVRGISRIMQFGKPDANQRQNISQALVAELKRRDSHWWYQMKLAEAVGHTDVVIDPVSRLPVVAQVLMETMADNSRHCAVRSEAARSIGRIPLDGTINTGLIAFEVAHLAQELATEYNKRPTGAFWKDCFLKTYLAFWPANAAGQARGDGLLTKVQKNPRHKTMVEDAYKQTLSLVNRVLPSQPMPIPEDVITPVTDWLKKNQPTDDKLAPGLPLYKPSSPVAEKINPTS